MNGSRRRYLYSYDITDDKIRDRVYKTLLDYGDHAQYSVFFCELNRTDLLELNAALEEHINQKKDQVLVLDLGHADNPLEGGMVCLGRPYEPLVGVVVV